SVRARNGTQTEEPIFAVFEDTGAFLPQAYFLIRRGSQQFRNLGPEDEEDGEKRPSAVRRPEKSRLEDSDPVSPVSYEPKASSLG
ncbi:MAG: hypothetical protein O7J95_05835, partial [Planctomycetota bacterium]|nr:hypothetical protein [Planctomycetota bacterium]